MNTIGEKPTCGTANVSNHDTPDHICNGVSAGGYCGSVLPGGSSDTLYTCDGSSIDPVSQKSCGTQCRVNPPGKADCCPNDANCSFANSTAATVLAYNANDSGTVELAKVLAAQAVAFNDKVSYDATTNTFANPSYKMTNLPAGNYELILHIDGYLDKLLKSSNGSTFNIPAGQ